MTVNLDNLFALKGAIASGEFDPEGKLIACKGDFFLEHSELIDLMGTANGIMKKMVVQMEAMTRDEHHAESDIPIQGWAVSTGEHAICVMGNVGVFVDTGLTNFKLVFRALGKEAGVI
jgi:roadblock/LC7 domain-containing protein